MSGRQAEAARKRPAHPRVGPGGVRGGPGAPITAVAKHAGVGISALYTRYGSKEELLRTLCTDGLQTFVLQTEAAIERVRQGHDHWQVFAAFMAEPDRRGHQLADPRLRRQVRPTPEMFALANRSAELSGGVLRPDPATCCGPTWCWHDISLSFELVAAIKFADPARTTELRHRYLALILDGMRAGPTAARCPARRRPGRRSANAGTPASQLTEPPGARLRRLPSCMACTRATGIDRPSSTSSGGSTACGGSSPAHAVCRSSKP